MKKWYRKLSLLIAGVMLSVVIFSYDVSAVEEQTGEPAQTGVEENEGINVEPKIESQEEPKEEPEKESIEEPKENSGTAVEKEIEEADELLEAERSGLENSWRYTNGQRAKTFAHARSSEFTTWPSVGEAKGIDVSHHQGGIDWKKVKICRC